MWPVLPSTIIFIITGGRTAVLTALGPTSINILIIPRNDPVVMDYYVYNFVTARHFFVNPRAPLIEFTDASARAGTSNRYFIRGRITPSHETGEIHVHITPLSRNRKLMLQFIGKAF